MGSKDYRFVTNTIRVEEIEIKGEREYYVTGYISTDQLDLVKDIVTEECMLDMAEQIKNGNIRADIEHEVFRDNPHAIPIAKFVDARVEKTPDGAKLWAKAKMNSAHQRFQEMWKSIKDGFVDAFSIAYKPLRFTYQQVEGVKARMLEQLKLLNVAFTAMPVNPGATFSEVLVKSLAEMEGTMDDKQEIKNEASGYNIPKPDHNKTEGEGYPADRNADGELKDFLDHCRSWASEFQENAEDFCQMAQSEPLKALKCVMKKDYKSYKGGKKSMESEKKPEAQDSQAEVKSLIAEMKSLVEENKSLRKESVELKAEIQKINDVLAKPVLKSILEGAHAGIPSVEQKGSENKSAFMPLDFVR